MKGLQFIFRSRVGNCCLAADNSNLKKNAEMNEVSRPLIFEWEKKGLLSLKIESVNQFFSSDADSEFFDEE